MGTLTVIVLVAIALLSLVGAGGGAPGTPDGGTRPPRAPRRPEQPQNPDLPRRPRVPEESRTPRRLPEEGYRTTGGYRAPSPAPTRYRLPDWVRGEQTEEAGEAKRREETAPRRDVPAPIPKRTPYPRPVARPQPAPAPAAQPVPVAVVPPVAVPMPAAVEPVRVTPDDPPPVARWLQNPDDIARALVLREVLGPPRAMQHRMARRSP